MVNVCVFVCECLKVCLCISKTKDAKLTTEDAQLNFDLLSEDEYSGNCGRMHYRTEASNVDVLYIARDLVYRL